MRLLLQGGKYCTMCATPCPTRKVVLAALAAHVATPAAAVAAPAEVTKVIFSAPTPGAVPEAPTAVAAVPAAVAKISGAVVGVPVPVVKKVKVT